MNVIDAQIHCWETYTMRPWDHALDYGTDPTDGFTCSDAIVAMNAVGIRASIISLPAGYRSPISTGIFRYDNSYAEEASLLYSGRLFNVARFDHRDPEIETLVTRACDRPGTVGLRCVIRKGEWQTGIEPYRAYFDCCEAHNVPMMILDLNEDGLDHIGVIARSYPRIPLIVDHLGLLQPPHHKMAGDPWVQLPRLLGLAELPNVFVKLSGVPTLSQEGFPYRDVWPYVRRVLNAFGDSRVMWGSDVTRVRGLHNYAEALGYVLWGDWLSPDEKKSVLGGTVRNVLGITGEEPKTDRSLSQPWKST